MSVPVAMAVIVRMIMGVIVVVMLMRVVMCHPFLDP